jgi:malate dehydrogenase (oxaloacetate-decarboxylating)(NADP+)
MSDKLRESAIEYHRLPTPGKLEIRATKPLANQRDLSLAYSPGVAAACEAIAADERESQALTARGNLVAVVTNGTAVLGLGAIGPLAAKPVMEGKACLFKKFAGIDVFDIEVDELDPNKLVELVASLEPTFGGINLEDIKAPECFEVEQKLKERMNIPVFHDDQHGTAIIVGAAIINGLRVVDKSIEQVRLVTSGAGAAGLACLDLLVQLGLPRENIIAVDRLGVVYAGRVEHMDPKKALYARDTAMRTLAEAVQGADIFLGLSAPGILTEEMVKTMADRPLVLALANPVPEIQPELARAARPDAVVATGRSDYPNQVNNVLCFPFLFRGALDVGATTINDSMKLACVRAIANLAMAEQSEITEAAYEDQQQHFGPEYLIPKPFDPRLIVEIAPAVAAAAMETGVATRPIDDIASYRQRLTQFVYKTGLMMKPIFERAKKAPKRIAYADGELETVLRAVQQIIDEGLATPILIGRPEVIDMRVETLGLRIKSGNDFEVCNPHHDARYRDYWNQYHAKMARKGITAEDARDVVRTNSTVIGAIMLERGETDALICGVGGHYHDHLKHIRDIIGLREDVGDASALTALVGAHGSLFMTDTNVTCYPTPAQVAETVVMAAAVVRRFGVEPKVALLSHSNFGDAQTETAITMREALRLVHELTPGLVVEGEMHADAALSQRMREHALPGSTLEGAANLLVFPTLDAANIAYNLLKAVTESVTIGPILMGVAKPVHILVPAATVRRVINMTALAVADAQLYAEQQ